MPSKKAKVALEASKSKVRQWTFETKGSITNFVGTVRDEKGAAILIIKEDEDYNQLSRLLNTSKHMRHQHDMKGLAVYMVDRQLVPMTDEEKLAHRRKAFLPIEITEVPLS